MNLLLAEWTGLEPATPGVTGRYSNQLNYHSIGAFLQQRSVIIQNFFNPSRKFLFFCVVGAERVELPTIAV